jgi:thioredoxin reductase (NADPH)
MYDIAVIGAGPAGLSAAINGRARNKEVCIVSNKPQGSLLAKSPLVENYPGMPGVSGRELIERMLGHALELGAHLRQARVINVLPMGKSFTVTTSDEGMEARAVIFAPGAAGASKAFLGEEEFLGRGVSYCATCDGMLFRDATICVVGLSQEAVAEAGFLRDLGATVHFIVPKIDEAMAEGVVRHLGKGASIHVGKVMGIEGDALGVTGVKVAAKPAYEYDSESGVGASGLAAACGAGAEAAESLIACSGVFVLRPHIAPSALLPTLETVEGYIAVDAKMRTSVPGVFAAGDCIGEPLQIAKAVGDGQIAAFAAVEYIDEGDWG